MDKKFNPFTGLPDYLYAVDNMPIDDLSDVVISPSGSQYEILEFDASGILRNVNIETIVDRDYLRLDCANDPLTENLSLDKDLMVGGDVYIKPGKKLYLDHGA